MKILYLTGLFPTPQRENGGIFVQKRLEVLAKRGVDFQVLVPVDERTAPLRFFLRLMGKGNSQGKWPRVFDSRGITYFFFPEPMGFWKRFVKFDRNSEFFFSGLKKSFDFSGFECVHSHWLFPHGHLSYLIWKEFGIPYLVTAHGGDVNVLPKKYPKIVPLVRDALENARFSLFVSGKLLQTAKQELGFSGKNALVIPNGVDTKLFHVMEESPGALPVAEKCKGKKVIGFVGNLVWEKRADRFPDIFHHVEKNWKDVFFLIIGAGPLGKYLKKEFEGRDNVFLSGEIPHEQVPWYLNLMDVLILPSRKEGFGCVSLEANACGVPVVGSDIGGIPESVGEGGFLVSEGDCFEERLAQMVLEVFNTPFSKESLVGRAKEFDWEKMVKNEMELYNDCSS